MQARHTAAASPGTMLLSSCKLSALSTGLRWILNDGLLLRVRTRNRPSADMFQSGLNCRRIIHNSVKCVSLATYTAAVTQRATAATANVPEYFDVKLAAYKCHSAVDSIVGLVGNWY